MAAADLGGGGFIAHSTLHVFAYSHVVWCRCLWHTSVKHVCKHEPLLACVHELVTCLPRQADLFSQTSTIQAVHAGGIEVAVDRGVSVECLSQHCGSHAAQGETTDVVW